MKFKIIIEIIRRRIIRKRWTKKRQCPKCKVNLIPEILDKKVVYVGTKFGRCPKCLIEYPMGVWRI